MFQAWPKIPRLENEVWHITEKIDGTNACIIIKDYDALVGKDAVWVSPDYTKMVFAQSRTRLIYPNTPEDKSLDNYGFAAWVKDNVEVLVDDLGVGYHYGEWWGQGINRGYDLTHKRFSLFNPTKRSSICHNVPELDCVNDISKLPMVLDEWKYNLTTYGSKAAEGYMKPEGMVVYAEKAKTYYKVIMDK